jgi:hypothetical protein
MARIERLPGVLAAWTDRMGGTVVVATLGGDTSDAERIVRRELAGRSTVTRLDAAAASSAIRECTRGERGWYRAREVIALSREEARVLAARGAARAAEAAGLDARETARLETLVRETCERVFEESARRERFDGRALDRELVARVSEFVSGLDLPPEKRARLREILAREVR